MHSSNGNGLSHIAGKNKPRLIFWELTKGCNLRCIHCRATATELSAPTDLSTQAARDIIDQIAEVSAPILVLSGGEPLSVPTFSNSPATAPTKDCASPWPPTARSSASR